MMSYVELDDLLEDGVYFYSVRRKNWKLIPFPEFDGSEITSKLI